MARARPRQLATARPGAFPEIDCIRNLLPPRVIAAAERRARLTGVGADRVFICGDAITEEAYLSALAVSLGTSFEPLDRVARADCPLDDQQLIQAAAAGLLPLREGGEIVWIIAPRFLNARYLADPRQPRPRLLRSFRLTSSERLSSFVARYAQKAIGKRAAHGLWARLPQFSNAPKPLGTGRIAAFALVALGVAVLANIPAAPLETVGATFCAIFLAAAAARLFSVALAKPPPRRRARRADAELPVYTIICALYREANVAHRLVGAIRAIDYPGIMAQTPPGISR